MVEDSYLRLFSTLICDSNKTISLQLLILLFQVRSYISVPTLVAKFNKKTPIILLEENVNHTTGKYVQNTLEQDN